MLKVQELQINYLSQPMGVEGAPQFSWKTLSDERNVKQTAYRLQISEQADFTALCYDSGRVESEQSAQVVLRDLKLAALTKYFARVKVTAGMAESDFSRPVSFITALPAAAWTGEFISAEDEQAAAQSGGTYLRREFIINKEVKQALAVTTALGLYKLYLNGRKVSDDEFAPGWTSYGKHLCYQLYDVTAYLQAGANAVGAHLGAGWYKGLMGFLGRRNNYGEQTAFLGELHITYTDGSQAVIKTDESWQGADSPVVFSEIYDGEIYDANRELDGWCEAGAAKGKWRPVGRVAYDKSVLAAQEGTPVQMTDELPARALIVTPNGETVIDFGQNLTGWAEFTAAGRAGESVHYRCFETLDAQGNVYTANLRSAKQEVRYTFKAAETVTFHPHFTYQGFRYLQLLEFPGSATAANFKAYAVHSAMAQGGTFRCSNPDLNQLQHNIRWGFKGNSLDIPTDCPQRNERVGWTGDAQIFCRTACYLENAYTFFKKWLVDVAADQTPEGGVPHVVPDLITGHEKDDWLLSQGTHSAAAWADVAVIAPWTLYQVYGDTEILRRQYDSMYKWIGFMETHAEDYIWNYKLQFGDWVALDAEEGSYYGATPNDLTCTAYFAYSTGLMTKIARVLGKADDAAHFADLYDKIVAKYRRTFFTETGHLSAQTQTAQIISLYFGLVPEAYKENVTADLLRLLQKENGHLVTGFVGTPYFCHALSQNGHLAEAYELLLKDDFPSWLYQVKMGATTVWEHWDGLKPDGTMWSPDMNSFNHYAYGAIGEWLYRVVAGLEIDETRPGYKHTLIAPQIGGGLTEVQAAYDSVYGTVGSHWQTAGQEVTLTVTVPVNTTATICLTPAAAVSAADGLDFAAVENGFAAECGSGVYEIKFRIA